MPKREKKAAYPRFGLKTFMESAATMYNVYLYSSFKREILKLLIREQDLDSHVKGCFGETVGSETITGMVLGTELQGKIQSELKTIQLNHQNGILISPAVVGSQDNDLYQCLGFLAHLAQQPDVRPIYSHYQSFLKSKNSMMISASSSQQELNEATTNETESVGTELQIVTKYTMTKTDPELMKNLKEKIQKAHFSKAFFLNRLQTNPLESSPGEVLNSGSNTVPIQGLFSIFSRKTTEFL